MTALPVAADFTGAGVTEGAFKTAITSLHDFLSGLLGSDGAQINAPAGLVGAPSYSFFGDLDTGLFTPGANQLTVTTHGVGRLTFNDAASVTWAADLLFTDATYDIGKSGATRPRDGFFSRNLIVGGLIGIGVTPSAWEAGYKAIELGYVGAALVSNASTTTSLTSNTYEAGGQWKYATSAAVALYQLSGGSHAWYIAPTGIAGNNVVLSAAMTLSANGCLGVTNSGTAGSATLVVTSNIAGDATNPAMYVVKYDASTATSAVLVQFSVNHNGQGVGQINANGANACAFGTFSDATLKEHVTDLPSQLENVLALRPVEFDYIASEGGGHQTGFIAQEVQPIWPDVIGQRKDGKLTLTDLNKNDARVIKAFQESHSIHVSRINAMKALLVSQGTVTQEQADAI